MFRRFGAAFVIVGLLAAARPVTAAENAFDAISSEAGVVVRIKNPQATIGKIAEFVDQVVPGFGQQVQAQAGGIGLLISNPTLAGVNQEADWWLAVYPKAGDQPPEVVFVIPATDLKAMKEALGDSQKFIEHGKFGVYTADADAADRTTALLKGTGKSIVESADKPSVEVFEKGDISVFIHVRRLTTVYKEALSEGRERFSQQLENFPEEVPGTPGINPKVLADIVGQVTTVLFQGIDDTQSCTIALSISKEGLAFEDLIRFNADSKTDKLLQKSPPSTLESVGNLPAGNLGYLGLKGDFSDLMQFGTKMMAAFQGGNPQGAKEMQAAMAEMQKLKVGSFASTFGLGAIDEGAIRSVTITEINDTAKVRELSRKLFQAMGSIETGGIKQTYDVKLDAEKHGQNTADVVTVKTDFGDLGDPSNGEMMERFMKALYGPEGMVTRTVYLKDKVVQAAGGGKGSLEKALSALEKSTDSAGTATSYQKARGRLGEKANLVVLFDLPSTIARAVTVVAEGNILPPTIPISPDMFKNLDIQPSYLGLSASTEPQGLRVKTSIPVEQVQGVAKLVQTVILLQAGGGFQQ
jgi:hypothetical protein